LLFLFIIRELWNLIKKSMKFNFFDNNWVLETY
jgi:hypothetical protein